MASSYATGETGAYTLGVAESQGGCSAQSLSVGQTVSGSLSTTDCVSNGYYYDLYQFTLGSSRTIQISMNSSAIDSYLRLYDASGNLITEDDDGGDGNNARITRTLSAGTYRVMASSYATGETGAYTLGVGQ